MTEITPLPPTAMRGRVKVSSPETTVIRSPQRLITSVICSREPLASLMPTIFPNSDRAATVSGSMFTPVRPGILYRMIGMSTASATAL